MTVDVSWTNMHGFQVESSLIRLEFNLLIAEKSYKKEELEKFLAHLLTIKNGEKFKNDNFIQLYSIVLICGI